MATLIKLTGRGADSWRGAFYFNADTIVIIDEDLTGGATIYHQPATPSGECRVAEVMDTPDEIARLVSREQFETRVS